MEQTKPDDNLKEIRRAVHGVVLGRDIQSFSSTGKLGEYSFEVVYAQESLRVLDMRLDLSKLESTKHLWRVFERIERDIARTAIDLFLEADGSITPAALAELDRKIYMSK